MAKSAVVILAAGIGSRMNEITSKTSKCIVDLGGLTPLEHTIQSFYDCGITDFIFVVGYYKDQVIDSVKRSMIKRELPINLNFVVNDKYNHHGCEYSLACASAKFNDYETVYITEGDLLLDKEYVRAIVQNEAENAVLIRSHEFIDNERSVVAINYDFGEESDTVVEQFIYDPDHHDVLGMISEDENIVGESIQLWKFTNVLLRLLTEELKEYKAFADAATSAVNHSGLFSINKVIRNHGLRAIEIDGYRWINLNTVQDVEHAKSLPWLNR